jgi:hypothetical protein
MKKLIFLLPQSHRWKVLDRDPLVRGPNTDAHQNVTDPQHCCKLTTNACGNGSDQQRYNWNAVDQLIVVYFATYGLQYVGFL